MPFIRSKSVVCSLWKEDDLSFPEDSSFESGGISARRAYGRKKCVNVVIHLPRWTLGLVIQKTRLITPLLSRVVTRSTSRVDSSTLRSPTPRNFVCETKFWQIWSISEGKCQNVRFSRFYKKENKNPVLFKVFFIAGYRRRVRRPRRPMWSAPPAGPIQTFSRRHCPARSRDPGLSTYFSFLEPKLAAGSWRSAH